VNPRDIELATIATWPAAVTERRNGWFYLASGGVTGRVNAVWPLDWEGGDVDAAIDDVETWYAARNLPPRFKLTDGAFAPAGLPTTLARRGYEPVMPTLIMTAPLAPRPAPEGVTLSTDLPANFDATIRETSKDDAEYDERLSIARRAPHPAIFAAIEQPGRVVSIGMSAATGAYAGVFLMRTRPEARRQGHAQRILRALLSRAADWGAGAAFLQVEADNAPAVTLYEREGFATLSTYRFWRKP
jgi:GNAT superfamily N-acetyltransferase